MAIFEPKHDYAVALTEDHQLDPQLVDPLLKLGVGSLGLLVGEHNLAKLDEIEQYYHKEASAYGLPVHSFVDSTTLRPVAELPNWLSTGLNKICSAKEESKL